MGYQRANRGSFYLCHRLAEYHWHRECHIGIDCIQLGWGDWYHRFISQHHVCNGGKTMKLNVHYSPINGAIKAYDNASREDGDTTSHRLDSRVVIVDGFDNVD